MRPHPIPILKNDGQNEGGVTKSSNSNIKRKTDKSVGKSRPLKKKKKVGAQL